MCSLRTLAWVHGNINQLPDDQKRRALRWQALGKPRHGLATQRCVSMAKTRAPCHDMSARTAIVMPALWPAFQRQRYGLLERRPCAGVARIRHLVGSTRVAWGASRHECAQHDEASRTQPGKLQHFQLRTYVSFDCNTKSSGIAFRCWLEVACGTLFAAVARVKAGQYGTAAS
jgi:hypothetical protein